MINFTKRYVNTISIIISIILFYIFNSLFLSTKEIDTTKINVSNQLQTQIEQVNENIVTKEEKVENLVINENNEKSQQEESLVFKENWRIEIPVIGLNAPIAEGTTKEVMDEYVGHFEETSKTNGNIGLAAHNRGYKVNYFQNLKKLKEGDEILYFCDGIEKKYYVKTHKIIEDTDWSMLENTKDNVITLITCVENEPEYRRCIQAEEKV